MSDFSGIWVALITPFQDASSASAVDHLALRRLVRYLSDAQVSGLVALGSTGEAAALDDPEQDAVLDTVLDAAQGLPVIAGLAGNHVGHLHARLQALNARPLAGVLSPAPYYVRPSQAGLVAHFTALADASRAPLVLYDIPYRTGVQMELATILTLAGHNNIHAIKDCGGSPDKTQALVADGRLQVLAGEDAHIFHTLCLGGAGAITAAAHLRPDLYVDLHRAIGAERLTNARAIHHRLMPLIRALFAEPNPAVIKAALHRMGLCSPTLRGPMVDCSPSASERAMQAMHALGGTPP